MSQQIVIYIGIRFDGYSFRVEPRSEHWIPSTSNTLADTVFIGFDEEPPKLESIRGLIEKHVVPLLTGSRENIGLIEFRDCDDHVIWESTVVVH